LTFARQSIGQFTKVNLPQLLESTIVLMEHYMMKNNIELQKSFQPQTHPFSGCAGELQQVFLNLINNALDAMTASGGGTLGITFQESEKGFHIRFSDTGIGIPPEVQKRIMEPFFTTKEIGKGTGLGLSVSYGIIKKHAGNLTFASETGKGTTFSIFLPGTGAIVPPSNSIAP
jgi:two-component system NtrC family sensor kinase